MNVERRAGTMPLTEIKHTQKQMQNQRFSQEKMEQNK